MEYIKPLNDNAYPERLGLTMPIRLWGSPDHDVPGKHCSIPMTEIINAITAAGLTPDDADLTQLSGR